MTSPARQIWLTAAEIAGLPGMPSAERHVRARAACESWPVREESGRGTPRKLYLADSLPPEARAEIERREAERAAFLEARLGIARDATTEHYRQIREAQLARSLVLTPHAQRRSEARAAILRARDAFAAACGLRKQAANEAFVEAFQAGQIPVDTYGVRIERLSTRTLWRWDRQAELDGTHGLGGRYGKRAGQSVIDAHPEWASTILGALAERDWERPSRIAELLRARYGESPSVSSIRDWIERWKRNNPGLWAHLHNPDAARGTHMPAVGSRSESITELNQLWALDSTKADLILADGKRYTLIAAIDIYSRRACVVVADSSSSRDVGQVLRCFILRVGIPAGVITDNGSDYISERTRAFLRALDIRHERTLRYRGDLKPHVERFFRTLQDDLIEMLPGFCGHNVAQAAAIRSRKTFSQRQGESEREAFRANLTRDELVGLISQWLIAYEARPHSGIDGCQPRQMAEEWPGEVRRITNERALDVLLQPLEKPRKVGKKGLHIDGAIFDAEGGEHGSMLDKWVNVRRDPSDVGRVWCFDDSGHYLFTAVCPERTGVSREELAAKATAKYREALAEGRAMLRAAKKAANTSHMAEEILAERLRAAGVGVVVPMHPPVEATVEHTTPALEGAEDLLTAQAQAEIPKTVPMSLVEHGRAVIRQMDAERERQRELIERGRQAEQSAIEWWLSCVDRLSELDERELGRWRRMAVRDSAVRTHVEKHRPELVPLLTRAEEALA